MADSGQDRTRRWRAHSRGDHRHCSPSRCPYAGRVERADVVGLRQAIEAEFADDPARLAVARRHVEQAAEKGQPGVAAVLALNRMIEDKRAAPASSIPPEGPFTATDATFALARWVTDDMLVRRLGELGELVAAEGWEAAVEEVARRIMVELDADVARQKRAGWGNYAAGLVERGS